MAGQMNKLSRLCGFRPAVFRAAASLALALAAAAGAVEPPAWWNNPNPGTAELIYERGSASGCRTEQEAWHRAYDAGLAMIRKRITDDTNLWSRLHLVGTDFAFDKVDQDALGRWHAWALVSYPRSQFETALARAQAAADKGAERTPIYVAPVSFGPDSEEQFPEVVAIYKALGSGNAIWQTVEDLLYDHGYEIVTAPASQTKSMLEQILGQFSADTGGRDIKLPELLLLCNMNFFEVKTERLSLGTLARNQEYHAELLLELYEVTAPHTNVKIPAKGEARDKDLLAAIQQAAKQAVEKLVERVRTK